MTTASTNTLIVTHPFGQYSRGDMITDPVSVEAILSSGNASMVVQTRIQQSYPAPAPAMKEH